MPMSLSGTDGVVPRTCKPLLSMGRGRNSVDRTTRSPAEGHPLGDKHNVGVTMDRGERNKTSGVEDTDGGVNIRY